MIENIKPSSLRKYIFEYCVLGLGACVGFLFYQYNDLNKYIRDTLTNENIETRAVLNENTKALDRVNNLILKNNQ